MITSHRSEQACAFALGVLFVFSFGLHMEMWGLPCVHAKHVPCFSIGGVCFGLRVCIVCCYFVSVPFADGLFVHCSLYHVFGGLQFQVFLGF